MTEEERLDRLKAVRVAVGMNNGMPIPHCHYCAATDMPCYAAHLDAGFMGWFCRACISANLPGLTSWDFSRTWQTDTVFNWNTHSVR